MRKLLLTAVALAPLAFALQAEAQTAIDTNRTTPIATATADGNAPDDIVIETTGAITLDDGVAITLNSDNDVTIEGGGDITMLESASGSTGILAQGGNTGTIDTSGVIRITDDLTVEDDDEDGNLDGPVASGTGRFGIRVTGPGPLDGDVLARFGGSITVEGNQSAGIWLESGVTGDFNSSNTIAVTGTDSYGIRTSGPVGGDSRIGGSVSVVGEDAVGIAYDGDVDGQILIDAAVRSTGYRYTTRPADTALELLDPDDLLIGGAAVRIAGDVGAGVVLDAAPRARNEDDDEEDDDLDDDGVIDVQEKTAELSSFGSAPALEIGSATRSVTLGVAGTGDAAYGLINRGSITAAGIYDGVNVTALRVGVAGGQTTTIEGGILNDGAISSIGVEANSTAAVIGAGADVPVFINQAALTAGTNAENEFTATGLLIQAGADLPVFENSGVVATRTVGGETNAVGIRDLSGSLTSLQNTGAIVAEVSRRATPAGEPADVVVGDAIAVDVRANTTGVTLLQFGELADPDSELPDADDDGVPDGNEPRIDGAILFGAGADLMDIRNGQVNGDLAFGAGADALRITGGAAVRGAVADSDGQLQIDVTDGILDARQTTATDISGLTVGGDGVLIVTLDTDTTDDQGFDVSGTATFENDAQIGVRFTELIQGDDIRSYSIVRAGDLNFGDIDQSSLTENSPYLLEVEAVNPDGTNEVVVNVNRRSAEDMNLIDAEAAAYDSIYGAIDEDAELLAAFLSETNRAGFIELYEQMLPDHSGGPLLALATGVDAVTRALSGRNQTARPGETSAWLQEINFYAEKDQDQAYGFESEGFGVAGGVERGTSMGAFGLTTAFTSTDLEDPQAQAEELLSVSLIELGLYWRAQGGNWTTWARAAGGYAWLEAERAFVGNGVFRSNESEWNGYTLAAAAGASYERTFGRYSFRPEVTAEYFMLSEDGRVETGGGDGFDLDIDERDGHLFAATAVMNFGMGFGENNWLRPELRVGWRQNISFDGGTTTGRFVSGGPDFMLQSDAIEGGGPIVGFRMNIGNDLGFLSIEGDAEFIEDYVRYALLLRASFRF